MTTIRFGSAAAGLLAVALLAGCTGQVAGTPAPSPGASPSTTPGRSSAPTPSTTVEAVTAPGGGQNVSDHTGHTATAADDLAGFLARAEAFDASLRAAAVLVNANLADHPVPVRPRTRTAVEALGGQLRAVDRAIPTGLDPALRAPLLTVYSDLAARSASLAGGYGAAISGDPGEDGGGRRMGLECLARGGKVAPRFARDLAALKAQARRRPPLRRLPVRSKAGVELALNLESIRLQNGCSLTCGGQIVAEWEQVEWTAAAVRGIGRGRVSVPWFTATWARDHWTVLINAC